MDFAPICGGFAFSDKSSFARFQFCERLFRIDIKVKQLPATRTTNLMLTRFARQAQKGFAVFTVAEYVLRIILRALSATAWG